MQTPFEGVAALPHWGLIRAAGADAASFLHGQLTQDVKGLAAGLARPAGYCSAKGRLLASFVVWRPVPELVLLACSADVLPATLKRLSMFVLRAKCKLSDATAPASAGDAPLADAPAWRLFGLAGPAAAAWLAGRFPSVVQGVPWSQAHDAQAQVVRLPDAAGTARWLWLQSPDTPPPALPPLELSAWQWLEVQSGLPTVVAATAEQFVPQMVNLELVGGVNFQKGCYPGQEVVARSQYRGTLKRRSFLFDADVATRPGQEVFASDDPEQPAGMVANAASLADGRHCALVELKIAALQSPGLHLGTAGGPRLHRSALPYTVPLEAA